MTTKPEFNPRQLMELAVQIMNQSVSERRTDGKASPFVGAVIYKENGEVEWACRGELRHGDHAEYTLLERKHRDQKLDGSILFATLEPCAPGARSERKLGCAERIVLARIKKVYVGIEDPDPTVDRKGIKYLQDNGIEVEMFDRDLQETIREANREFIAQATERATTYEEKKPKTVTLSKLEKTFDEATPDEFSEEALEKYRTVAGIKEKIGSPDLLRRLGWQGLVKRRGKTVIPTGFGMLLFGKEPRVAMPQAGLLGTIHYPGGTEETEDFVGPLVLIPDRVESWLRNKLPNVIDRSHMQHELIPAFPFELIREAVVNALVHRDYGIEGAKCHIEVTPDTVTVKSPGVPQHPVTLQQLQTFSAPMLSRNPQLQYVLSRMAMANERGLGMKTLRSIPERNGLPLPRYTFEDPYLVLTLFRNGEAPTRTLSAETREAMNPTEQKGWQWLSTKGRTSSSHYAKAMNVDERTARRHLNHFVELGLVKQTGSGPSIEYVVVSG